MFRKATECAGAKQISGIFCSVRISVRIKSKRFHIILTGFLTEITAGEKNFSGSHQ